MTDDRHPPPPAASHRPRPVKPPTSRTVTIKTTIASLIAAGAITAGLAAQMATGHDPALGAQNSDAAAGRAPTQPSPSDVGMSSEPEPAPVVTSAS